MTEFDNRNHKKNEKDIETLVSMGVIQSAGEFYMLPTWEISERYDELFASIRALGTEQEAIFRMIYNNGITDIVH